MTVHIPDWIIFVTFRPEGSEPEQRTAIFREYLHVCMNRKILNHLVDALYIICFYGIGFLELKKKVYK